MRRDPASAARTPFERIDDHARGGRRALPRARARRTRSSSPRACPRASRSRSTTQDGFVDLCRGPHLQTTKPIKRVQADLARRRLLARRLGQPDADAHLRHGVLRPGRARRVPGAHRGGARGATTAGSAASSTSSTSATPRRARRSGTRAGWCSSTSWRRLWRELNASRGYQEVRTPILYDTELWKRSGPLGQLPRQDVPDRAGRGPPVRPQADELPGPRRDLQPARGTPTATCRCGWPSRASCTATRTRARCTACCACATSRRTTRTSSAAGTRSRTRSSAASSSRSVIYETFGLRRARRALDAAGQAARQRGGVGPHGGRARRGARDGGLGLRA